MADKTISDLTPASEINSPDLFVLEQNSTAKKLSGQTLVTYLLRMIDGHGGITSITWTESGTAGDGQEHIGTITMADGSTSTVTFRDGARGNPGQAYYVWVKWAGRQPTTNNDMSDTPDAWMGIYTGTASSAPASYTQYKWYNTKGMVGDPARLVNRSVLYQVSTSGTSPDGTWQETVPSAGPGEYLWTHIELTFDSGSVDWYEVARQGTNGVDGLGAVSTVNGISPDQSNNVSLTAANIPYGNSDVAAQLQSVSSDVSNKQQSITASGILKGRGSGVVVAADKGVDYGAMSFTVTLQADNGSNWTDDTYTVSDARFVASGYAYHVAPSYTSIDDFVASIIYAEDVTTTGQMTFHCKAAPENAIVMNIERVVSA